MLIPDGLQLPLRLAGLVFEAEIAREVLQGDLFGVVVAFGRLSLASSRVRCVIPGR